MGTLYEIATELETLYDMSTDPECDPQALADTIEGVMGEFTKGWDQDTEDNTIAISYEDAQCLMKIAYAEGGNQGVTGQFLIMNVVYNRVISEDYPDTISEVITQPGQFESYQNGMYEAAEPTAETHLALAELEKGKDLNAEIIAFETVANHKSLEKYFKYSFTYKGHDFYVQK